MRNRLETQQSFLFSIPFLYNFIIAAQNVSTSSLIDMNQMLSERDPMNTYYLHAVNGLYMRLEWNTADTTWDVAL